mgnify:FL=1
MDSIPPQFGFTGRTSLHDCPSTQGLMMTPTFSLPMPRLSAFATAGALALLLAACGPTGRSVSTAGVAELEQRSEATETNLASLNQVVAANPNTPEPYNTRGAAYARIGRFQEAITDFLEDLLLRL